MLLQGVWHDSYGIHEGEEVNVSFGLSRYLCQLTELLATADKIRSDAVKMRPDVAFATSRRSKDTSRRSIRYVGT